MDTEVDDDKYAASGNEFMQHSELLCFLRNKSSIIAHDGLIKICADKLITTGSASAVFLVRVVMWLTILHIS